MLTGTVVEFDAAVGLGVIEADDVAYPFHCIEIADGSRDIAVGTAVQLRGAPQVRPLRGRLDHLMSRVGG